MNWTFLNPYLLFGLPLILLPIIIHFIFTRRAKPLLFSELKFLREAMKMVIRRFRLLQLLLLILRVLIILLAVVLVARPVIMFMGAGGQKQKSFDTIVILDNSYSMGQIKDDGRTAFEHGKEAAGKILSLSGETERIALWLASDRVDAVVPAFVSDISELRRGLKDAEQGCRPSDWKPVLKSACELLMKSEASSRQLMIISDFTSGWSDVRAENTGFDRNIRLILVDVGKDKNEIAENFTLKSIVCRNAIASEPWSIKVFTSASVKNLPVSLWIDGKKTEQAFIDGESREFLRSFDRAGWYSGYLQIDRPDVLPSDNRFYFSIFCQPRLRVVCVDGDPGASPFQSETFYLKFALAPKSEHSAIAPEIVNAEEFGKMHLEDSDIIIYANADMTSDSALRLRRFVGSGKGLIIFLGDNTDPDRYNSFCETHLIPAKLRRLVRGSTVLNGHVRLVDSAEPVTISKAKFEKYFQLIPMPDAKVLAEFGNGDPLIVVSDLPAGGRILMYASTADRKWNNLPARPAFLPLIQQMCDFVSRRTQENVNECKIGIMKKPMLPEQLPRKIEVTDPSGVKTEKMAVRTPEFTGLALEFSSQGIYRVDCTGDRNYQEFYGANLDVESGESDLRKFPPEKVFPGFPKLVVTDPSHLEEKIRHFIQGREISTWLVLAVLFLLLLEFLLAGFRPGRTEPKIARYMVLLVMSGLLCAGNAAAQENTGAESAPAATEFTGNHFVFMQLRYGSTRCDPNPFAWQEIKHFLDTTTSIRSEPEVRMVTLVDPALFDSAFLYWSGTEDFRPFTEDELKNLRRFLEGGGMLFIDDALGVPGIGFDKGVRRELQRLYPGKTLAPVSDNNALFFAFYLLPKVTGTRQASTHLEGIEIKGRTAVIYSANDLLGVWERDKIGNWLKSCAGGENKRLEAMKLFVNIIFYCLCDTYKLDDVHRAAIQEKMKFWPGGQ